MSLPLFIISSTILLLPGYTVSCNIVSIEYKSKGKLTGSGRIREVVMCLSAGHLLIKTDEEQINNIYDESNKKYRPEVQSCLIFK
jgi:hypothetical protein